MDMTVPDFLFVWRAMVHEVRAVRKGVVTYRHQDMSFAAAMA